MTLRWCGKQPDDPEPRYGDHATAEAVIRHVAQTDEGLPTPIVHVAHRLRSLAVDDRVLAAALWDLGDAAAAQLYRDERRAIGDGASLT